MNADMREKIEAALLGIKSGAQSLRQSAFAIDELDGPELAIDTSNREELRTVARAAHSEAVRVILSALATAGHAAALQTLAEVEAEHG